MIQKLQNLNVVAKSKHSETEDITSMLMCTASVCVVLVMLYLALFDGRGI